MKNFAFILFIIPLTLFAEQNRYPMEVWNDENEPDSIRFKTFQNHIWDNYLFSNPDSAIILSYQLMKKAKEKGYPRWEGSVLAIIGTAYELQFKLDSAIIFYEMAIERYEKVNRKKSIANLLLSIGTANTEKGDYNTGLEYMTRSKELMLENEMNPKHVILAIANLYFYQKDYEKTLEMYDEYMGIATNGGDTMVAYSNIGLVYYNLEKFDSSKYYFNKALDFKHKSNNNYAIGSLYNQLAKLYMEMASQDQTLYDSAYKYFNKSNELKSSLGSNLDVATSNIGIANIYFRQGKLDSAEQLVNANKELIINDGSYFQKQDLFKILYEIYKKQNKHSKSLEMLELYYMARDSVANEENRRNLLRNEYQYKYEKQKAIDDAKFESEMELEHAQQEKQKLIIIGVVCFAILAIIFLIVIYKRWNVTKEQKVIIEEQNEELQQTMEEIESQRDQIEQQRFNLAEKNEEITSSINYAKKIQKALLNVDKEVIKHFPPFFILYKPRDIVSGDFYWATEKNGYIYCTAADCTGHGVPGAFMSMLGISFLNEIIKSNDIITPAEILDQLRARIIKELGQGEEGQSKDGMDMGLVRFNLKTKEIMYAGANNPLYMVTNDLEKIDKADRVETIEGIDKKLIEFTANKQPIGYHEGAKSFTDHKMQTLENETFYLFSDGFADQFGGKQNKKYGYKKFRQFLLHNSKLELLEQHDKLKLEIDAWIEQGEDDQIDDICVIGVRV